LSGNDDAGQMSAWYVFAAMGFYPVNPVSGEYLLSTPLFDRMHLQLSGGRKFMIEVQRKTEKDRFISRVFWKGKPYFKNYITYQMIMQGGKLEFRLSDRPGHWGADPAARTKGLSNE
jgi:putative alpha-1,2-mannosidase